MNLDENTTLANIQNYVDRMEKERGFDKDSILHKFLLLTEELGELGKTIRKNYTNMGLASNAPDQNTSHEIADVLIVLCSVANKAGVDIGKALHEKESINKTRVWK